MYISVVIPTYNRLPILQKCLTALEGQEFADDKIESYEVIVVDDGSSDRTLVWLAEDRASLPHVKVIEQNHQGAATARNLGVESAAGDTIVFIDSDLVVTSTFLQSHADTLTKGKQDLKKRSPVYLWCSN